MAERVPEFRLAAHDTRGRRRFWPLPGDRVASGSLVTVADCRSSLASRLQHPPTPITLRQLFTAHT